MEKYPDLLCIWWELWNVRVLQNCLYSFELNISYNSEKVPLVEGRSSGRLKLKRSEELHEKAFGLRFPLCFFLRFERAVCNVTEKLRSPQREQLILRGIHSLAKLTSLTDATTDQTTFHMKCHSHKLKLCSVKTNNPFQISTWKSFIFANISWFNLVTINYII